MHEKLAASLFCTFHLRVELQIPIECERSPKTEARTLVISLDTFTHGLQVKNILWNWFVYKHAQKINIYIKEWGGTGFLLENLVLADCSWF